jgi:DNA-binding protein HU-beta
MSKAFISETIRQSVELTGVAANRATNGLIDAIVEEMKKTGKFTLPGFGTFTVRKTKARKALNPRTGESIRIKAGKTVRFKASPGHVDTALTVYPMVPIFVVPSVRRAGRAPVRSTEAPGIINRSPDYRCHQGG